MRLSPTEVLPTPALQESGRKSAGAPPQTAPPRLELKRAVLRPNVQRDPRMSRPTPKFSLHVALDHGPQRRHTDAVPRRDAAAAAVDHVLEQEGVLGRIPHVDPVRRGIGHDVLGQRQAAGAHREDGAQRESEPRPRAVPVQAPRAYDARQQGRSDDGDTVRAVRSRTYPQHRGR
jgi:hypothetical protein